MEEKQVDVRIICATHKDLNALVESGQFRQDLFYRLNVVSITMPPLRELRDDLPQLIRVLLQRILHDETMSLTPEAKKALLQYSYPGNFRELENILERAIALSKNHIIEVDDLQIHSYQLDNLQRMQAVIYPQIVMRKLRITSSEKLRYRIIWMK